MGLVVVVFVIVFVIVIIVFVVVSELFLGPKTRFSAQKSVFCHTTPNFVDGPFVALRDRFLSHLGIDFFRLFVSELRSFS